LRSFYSKSRKREEEENKTNESRESADEQEAIVDAAQASTVDAQEKEVA